MVLIGIDPQKASHSAVAIDHDERPIARLQIPANRRQVPRLLAWAEPLGAERTWAVESASGLGRLLAQQLLAAGEHVMAVHYASVVSQIQVSGDGVLAGTCERLQVQRGRASSATAATS